MDEELIIIKCEKCGNIINIKKSWFPGGCNDYGSFVLKCDKCGHIFEHYVGRDIDCSDVISGATIVDRKCTK